MLGSKGDSRKVACPSDVARLCRRNIRGFYGDNHISVFEFLNSLATLFDCEGQASIENLICFSPRQTPFMQSCCSIGRLNCCIRMILRVKVTNSQLTTGC